MFHRFSIILLVALILVVFAGPAMACGSCPGGLDAFSVCTLSIDPPSADEPLMAVFDKAITPPSLASPEWPPVAPSYATIKNAETRGAVLYSYTSPFGQSGNLVNYSVVIVASGTLLHQFFMG